MPSTQMIPAAAQPSRSAMRRHPRRAQSMLGMRTAIAVSLAPALVLFGIFYLAPMVVLGVTSLASWAGPRLTFIGIENYARILGDDTFWRAALNTLIYAAVAIFVQTPLSILVGIQLSQHPRGWKTFRAVLFLPYLISGAALAMVFLFIYNPRYGFVNSVLRGVGIPTDHDWLFTSSTALPAVSLTFALVVGFGVILVMAEIASIPRELYEAAELDGAGSVKRHIYLTVPLLRNVTGTLVLLSLVAYLGFFDVVYLLTGGGPRDATVTLVLYAYRAYLSGAWGYASAVGVLVVVIGLVAVVSVRRLFKIGESE